MNEIGHAITHPDQIEYYSMYSTLKALELEMKGIRMTRNYSAYVAIKKRYGLKGNRQKIYDLFTAICDEKRKELQLAGLYRSD